jgi:hypothetical protein
VYAFQEESASLGGVVGVHAGAFAERANTFI